MQQFSSGLLCYLRGGETLVLTKCFGVVTFHATVHQLESGAGGGGGGGPGVFGGPLNFIKRGKTLRACGRKCHVLVINNYADRNPVSTPDLKVWCDFNTKQVKFTGGDK